MTNKPWLQFALLAALLSLTIPARASGEAAGDFLLVNISARETSLGGIYAPFYAKPAAAVVNPAALAGIRDKYIIFSHYTTVFSTHFEQLVYAQPISETDCVGGMFMFDSTDNLQRTDDNGYPVEQIENYDIIIGGVYSKEMNREWAIGANVKYLLTRLYKTTGMGAVGNVGLVYRGTEKKYIIGASFENFGAGTPLEKEKALYPLIGRVAYGFEILRDEDLYRIAAYIEERAYLNQRQAAETSFGLEAAYMNFFTFRYGYIFGRAEGRIALGIGFKVKNIHLDYAYQPFFISDNAHRFTLAVLL
jgi:hypothetical protein